MAGSRTTELHQFAFTLASDKLSQTQAGTIGFTVHLASHAARPWLVYLPFAEGPGASFTLIIKDHQTGREVAPPVWADAQVPPGPLRLARLVPGRSLSGSSRDTVRSFGMIAGHSYDVSAVYHSPLRERTHRGIPILARSDGVLTSNTITVSILP